MRLKKLHMKGFKSFADKSSLTFNPGITGIVGPNGCGKSNISDAFRWVLGAQSAKALRGNKMHDVIFAGTPHRKPSDIAEVTLTFSNEEGLLPIEYQEVSVTRKLYRSGESEYFINNHSVRLKDIDSLFLDSGIGKNAFCMFEQGKIDQVINLSPVERRYIFEEASGIMRFLQRKREALSKLEQVGNNLDRVKDIHREVEKQIVVLEAQAEKAKNFKENRSKLDLLEKAFFVARWEHLDKKLNEIEKQEEEHTTHFENSSQNLNMLREKLLETKHILQEQEKHLHDQKTLVQKRKHEKEMAGKEGATHQEKLQESAAREKRLTKELEDLRTKRKERHEEVTANKKRKSEIEGELTVLESDLKGQREKVQKLEKEIAKFRDTLQKKQQERVKLLQEESRLESELKQNSVRLENSQERKQSFLNRKDKLGKQVEDIQKEAVKKKEDVSEIAASVDKQKVHYNNLEKGLQKLGKEIDQLQETTDICTREITEFSARQKVLVRLRDDMEGFSSGTKKLLQEAADPKSPLFRKITGVYAHITPQKGSEKAIAIAMKPYSQTLVVQSKEDYKQVINFAQQKKLNDFSLICSQEIEGNPSAHKENSLYQHVSKNPLAEHFLKNVFEVKDLEQAVALQGKHIGSSALCQDEGFVDSKRVVFYAGQGENNIFLREAELKSVEDKLKEKDKEKQKLQDQLKSLRDQRTAAQQERMELDKAIRKEEMKLVEVNFGLQKLLGDIKSFEAEKLQIDKEVAATESQCVQLNKLIEGFKEKYQAAKQKVVDIQTELTTLEKELQESLGTLKGDHLIRHQKDMAYQKIVDENRKLLHNLNLVEVKDQESLNQEKRLEQEITFYKDLQTQAESKGIESKQLVEQINRLLSEGEASCVQADKDVKSQREALAKLEEQIQAEEGSSKKRNEQRYQLGISRAQLESHRQNVEKELNEKHHLTIPEAQKLQLTLEKPLDQTEKQIRALRNELEKAGDINMTSIEEFDKHKVRYEFLGTQMGDLHTSKEELVQIIAELDKESRKMFEETFEKIRLNFQRNFSILFNGGVADLQFTETTDILEAGVEIIAKPVGKQMRTISLLSGGEKCLTAMALLFAIFEVKPAPFCILDEIDAPLDDSNVERFLSLVKQFIERCQFIIITHNKCTMSIADILFGVSMEEKGVSKLLSMEFAGKEDTVPEPALV